MDNINWNSIKDLQKLRSKIDSRLSELKRTTNQGIKPNTISVFNSCINIINTDISTLYLDLECSEVDNDYYVYAHCDPLYGLSSGQNGKSTFAPTLGLRYIPFYVGKGIGNRAYNLNRNESHRKIRQRSLAMGKEIQAFIIKDNLTKYEALALESKLIDIFGLKASGGWLVNLDEGHRASERRSLYLQDYLNINKMLKFIYKK